MIRPIDIQEKDFSRSVRGYKEDEVNQFLDARLRKKTAGLWKSWRDTEVLKVQ